MRQFRALVAAAAAAAGCTSSGVIDWNGLDAAAPAGTGGQGAAAGLDAANRGNTGGAGGAPVTGDAGADLARVSDGGAGGGGAGGRIFSTNRDDFFGASRCAAAQVLLCEDFEAGSVDAKRWQKSGPGTTTVETTRAARGTHALHVHADGNGFAYLKSTSLFPVAGNTLYGRMLVWFDTMPSAPQWAHWTVAEAAGTGNGSLVRVGGQYDGKINRFGVGSDSGPTGDWTNLDQDPKNAVVAVPTQSWVCLEWMWDGGTNQTRFWWDGVEHPSLATTASAHGGSSVPYELPQMTSAWVGWWLYQAGPTPDHFDVWIDEVALDGARIGCSL